MLLVVHFGAQNQISTRMKDTLKVRVRFGAFELDLKAGELWEGGRKVVLPEQPFQVLCMLLESGGDIVSRDAIRKKLWPNDTVVEFEHSISAAINKLRRFLGDSAEEPKYIETVARRGYRFLAPVEWLDSRPSDPASSHDSNEGVLEPPPLETSNLSGKTVSHYRVLEIIGGGGMGVVYRAEDLKLPRAVALKVLPEDVGHDPRMRERFELEARAASVLEHPNICSIYEFGEHVGKPFIVMQMLHGQTLRDRMAAPAPFAVDELLNIAIQIAHGLEAAHEKGVIHRDIKPANIFLTEKGVVKILDFGLAKLLQPSGQNMLALEAAAQIGPEASPSKPQGLHPTRLGSAVGTEGYMSPEQVRGEDVDARTDLFSFGVVLYEMVTGHHAFSGKTEAVVRVAIARHEPVPVHKLNATLPPELEPIINRALEKDRELRYQSAAQMRADLEAVRGRKVPAPLPPGPEPRWPRRWKVWQLAAAVVLVCAVAIAGLRWYQTVRPQLTDKDSIVLADFTNKTADPVLDDALDRALQVELRQTPFLNLLSPDKVRGTLKLLNGSGDVKLTPEPARGVCLRSNSKAVVGGSILDVGNRYRIELKATNCQTGKTFATTTVEAQSRDEIVKTLGIAGAEFRRKLGEPEASVRKFNKPLEEATSSSLEALQALTQAADIKRKHGDAAAAAAYLKRAVELDPNFAQAYLNLGIGYLNAHDVEPSVKALRKAYDLRTRVTERDRFAIEAFYYTQVTGQADKSIAAFEEWAKTYPEDPIGHMNLAAELEAVGQYEKAAAAARESVRLRPSGTAYVNLITSYVKLDRLDEAKAAFDEAQAHKLDDGLLYLQRYILAFLQGDQSAMQQQVKWAMGKPSLEDGFLGIDSRTEAFYGRMLKARSLAEMAVDSAKHANAPQSAADSKASEALQEAEIGNRGQAQQLAREALALSTAREVRAVAALALARAGDPAQAEKLLQELDREYPLDTMMQNYTLPTIRAAVELERNNPAIAIDILKIALPYEEGFDAFGSLYPAYVRGEAYLKAGQGQPATMEFQKMIDHPGIMENFVTGALAHLQLGRAQAMNGDKDAARKSYQDFLILWKDADPNIPILKQAKAEYAKLQ